MEHIKTSSVEQQSSENMVKTAKDGSDHYANSTVESWVPDIQEDTVEKPMESIDGQIDENAVIDAISTVYDPEIPVNVYDLGLIYAVDLHDDGRVHVEMTLTAPNCPSAQELPLMVQHAIEKVSGVTEVVVEIVWDPPWDMSRMSDEARLTLNMF